MSEIDKVEALARQIVRALHPRDNRMLLSLHHNVTRREFVAELALERLRFLARDDEKQKQYYYLIEPYYQTDLDQYEYERFEPEPTYHIWISDENPVKPDHYNCFYFTVSPGIDGYRICSTVHWDPEIEIVDEPPEFIDLRRLYHTMRPLVQRGLAEVAGVANGCLRFDYSVRGDVNCYSYDGDPLDGAWHNKPSEMFLRRAEGFDDAHDGVLYGTERFISLDGAWIELNQNEFEATYPYWVGKQLYEDHIRSCARKVLQDSLTACLNNASIPSKTHWNVLLHSYDDGETAPIKQTVVTDGFTVFETDQPPPFEPVNEPLPCRVNIIRSRHSESLTDYSGIQKKLSELYKDGIDDAECTRRFAVTFSQFLQTSTCTADDIFESFIEFYREVRTRGGDDTLMLEWGATKPLLIEEFADLRQHGDLEWGDNECEWFGMTRQVRSGREDDDTALCVYLYYETATNGSDSGMLEINGVNSVEASTEKLRNNIYVSNLLSTKPTCTVVFASSVG